MEDRIPLKLVGITYNQVESGVYALILQEEDGERRLPIIIGYPEAQAIECKMQEVQTPRPLTHDLFIDTLNHFGIELLEVRIHRMPDGVFAADIVFQGQHGNLEVVDGRSSDAIAMAIRTGAPIFTSEKVMAEAGLSSEYRSEGPIYPMTKKYSSSENKKSRFSGLSNDALEKALEKAVNNEDYEKAGEIKKELDKRNNLE